MGTNARTFAQRSPLMRAPRVCAHRPPRPQVIIFVIYLLEGQRKRARPRRGGLVARIQGRIQRYMTIKLALSLANGLLAWATYRLLRLDLALAFGFIHFVLNFIPSVGPLVATLIPLPVVLVDPKLKARAPQHRGKTPATGRQLTRRFLRRRRRSRCCSRLRCRR